MQKKLHFVLISLLSLGTTSLLGAPEPSPSPDQTAAESKRANEFLDKVFDEFVATHPQIETSLGIKTHNDQWNDISDEAAKRDLDTEQKNLAELKRQFPKEKLDAQTQLSLELYEFNAARDVEAFQFRLDSYPVNQMGGLHSETPTFLINIHKIDNEKDAQAYIARLNGVPKLFEQLLENLRVRESKGVMTPRFVFPLVLDACHKVIQGQPFDSSANKSPLLEDFTKK